MKLEFHCANYCQEPESQYVIHMPGQNLVYVIKNISIPYFDALEECRAMGGYLSMPKTLAQFNTVAGMISNRTWGKT